jgi:hypothetical protein
LEESQLELEKVRRQQRKSLLSIQSLEDEVQSMKNNKRMSIGLDAEDYKEEIAK